MASSFHNLSQQLPSYMTNDRRHSYIRYIDTLNTLSIRIHLIDRWPRHLFSPEAQAGPRPTFTMAAKQSAETLFEYEVTSKNPLETHI